MFRQGALPDEVAEALRRACAQLGPIPVAVRSSATAEDLPGISFAGQQESYLNVRGESALLEAVRRCWASLWTARAIAYRQKMGIDQGSLSMAVVVQEMVPSESSGVLFTANPATGDRGELVVEAAFGLGEAVVSGRVTPDSFVLDRASLETKRAALGAKAVMVVPAEGQGTAVREVPEGRRGERALSGELLRELSGLALRAEELFGGVPQDVEWAVAGGRCWLLQARPMTGLPPAPLNDVRWEPPVPGTKWVRRQIAENMPEPLSPLFEELYLRQGLEDAMARVLVVAGKDGLVSDSDRPWFTTVNGYAYMRGSFAMSWKILLRSIGAIASGKIIRAIFRHWTTCWRDEVLQPHLATVEHWRGLDLASASDERLLDGIRELARSEATHWGGVTFVVAVTRASDLLLSRFLALAMPGSGLTSAVFLRGFPSRALEAEAELQAIAEQIRGSDGLRSLVASTPARRLLDALEADPDGRPVVERLRRYLERYGHQVYSLDFVTPNQAEDPTPVLLSLKAQVQQPGTDVRARQAEMARGREDLVERTARSLDPLRRRTDIGGVAAHGSIVAREYGIPAVMGTGNATQRIASGQQVTVDGDAGIVTLSMDGAGGAGWSTRNE